MMATTVTMTADDLRLLADALDRLAEMRVNNGVEVETILAGEDTLSLEWDDAAGCYVIGGVA